MMGKDSAISWCDSTWQVVAGCTPVSDGCRSCYSAKLCATRLSHFPWARGLAETKNIARISTITNQVTIETKHEWTGEVLCREDQLNVPLRWKAPKRIFVGDRGDLFHEKVSFEFIAAVFGVMSACPQHTFMILTKRPEKMREWMQWDHGPQWPLPNVWLGTSVSTQRDADKFIPELFQCHAALRFVSVEPMLEAIDLRPYLYDPMVHNVVAGLDWVICGGESGQKARHMQLQWALEVRDRCRSAGVPFFFKQYGASLAKQLSLKDREGRDPAEWVSELKQEFPEVKT
jgi:protein gp37